MERDLEETIWSSYNWRGIWRGLFGAFILIEKVVWSFYISEEIWRGLFKIIILIKGYNKEWRDPDKSNWSSYISGEILYWWRNLEGVIWSFYN